MQWRVTELYGAQWRRRQQRAAKIVFYVCGFSDKRKFRVADIRFRQAALQGASGATRLHMICPQHCRAIETARPRTLRRAMASASAKMPRKTGVGVPGFLRSVCGLVGPSLSDLLTTNAHTSERNLFGQVRFSELEWWHLGAAVIPRHSMRVYI